MKVNRLETHDRFQHYMKQSFEIQECAENLLEQRPFGEHPFYMWVHARTAEDGVTKELIWQPRLTRPKPQTNSMLFKANPLTREIRVCWMIPPDEMFGQYKKGNVTEHDITEWSIDMYLHHREELAKNEPDDLTDEQIDAIYKNISKEAKYKKAIGTLENFQGLTMRDFRDLPHAGKHP